MARPKTAAFGELILPVFTQWEKVGNITGILSNLQNGMFYDAALLVDQMMRDDRIRASLNTRLMAVLSMPMHMEAVNDTKRAQRLADDATELWKQMVPRAELMSLMKWGLTLGVGLARKEWTRSGSEWMPTIKVWHPAALRFDLMTDLYMLRTQDGEIPIMRDDPNWLLFTPFGYKYARTEGMLLSLAMLYLCRQWGFRDRARHSERHGQPFLQLIVPAESDAKDKNTARMAISALGSETVSVTPQGEDGNKFDWKLIEATTNANEVFGALIDHVDECIAVLLLGQSSSTTGQAGLGSQEKAGDTVRRDIMRFDAECIGDIGHDGILAPWAEYNYQGARDLAPTPVIDVDPPEDGQKKALELSTLGDAISKLEKYGVDVRAVLEQTGIPMLTIAEAEAKREELENKAAEMINGPADDKSAEDDKAGPKDDKEKPKVAESA